MILSHPSAPEGRVATLARYSPSDFVLPCAVLCRNTAPLVSFAYSLLSRDVPCRVLGREIGAQFVGIAKKLHAVDLDDFRTRLSIWKNKEVERCNLTNTSPERVYDQYDCLVMFCKDLNVQDVGDLIHRIESLFDDKASTPSVLLSTIHKSKGLEWPTVFLLDFAKLLPSKYATSDWQKRQERNLAYVAITRSMNTLFYISSDNWKE